MALVRGTILQPLLRLPAQGCHPFKSSRASRRLQKPEYLQETAEEAEKGGSSFKQFLCFLRERL